MSSLRVPFVPTDAVFPWWCPATAQSTSGPPGTSWPSWPRSRSACADPKVGVVRLNPNPCPIFLSECNASGFVSGARYVLDFCERFVTPIDWVQDPSREHGNGFGSIFLSLIYHNCAPSGLNGDGGGRRLLVAFRSNSISPLTDRGSFCLSLSLSLVSCQLGFSPPGRRLDRRVKLQPQFPRHSDSCPPPVAAALPGAAGEGRHNPAAPVLPSDGHRPPVVQPVRERGRPVDRAGGVINGLFI